MLLWLIGLWVWEPVDEALVVFAVLVSNPWIPVSTLGAWVVVTVAAANVAGALNR